MRRAHFVLLAIATLSTSSCGGGGGTVAGPRTGATAADELREYAQFVRDVHPAPFRFVTAADFDARVAAEADALGRSSAPTDLEVAGAFQRALAPLGDAHIAVTSRALQPGAAGAQFLPLLVKDVEGALLVDAAADPGIVGAELVAVEGVTADELRRSLEPVVMKDGVNGVAALRGFEREFTKLYHMIYGTAPRYRVSVKGGEAVLEGAGHEAISALDSQRRSAPVRGAPARDPGRLPFQVPRPDGTFWLRMPSFGSPDQEGYRAKVDALMAAAKGAPALVIDLRGNEGGLRTHGIALLNHILSRPYAQWARMSARVRELPEPYRGRAIAAFGTDLGALGAFSQPPVDGRYVYEGDPLAALMRPEAPFDGRVLALVDGRTNSAANELLIALKHARPDAVVVGEEAGGACAEHVGELPTQWTTPTFGVSVLMSIIRLEHVSVPGCQPGRGLEPGLPVRYTRGDFDAGRDPYEEAVRQALLN